MSDRRNYNPKQKLTTQQPPTEAVEKIDATDLKEAMNRIESNPDIVDTMKKLVKEHNQYLEDVKPDPSPAVYNVSKNVQSGKVEFQNNVRSKDFSQKEAMMEEMLTNIEKEIIKQQIEIEVHTEIDSTLVGKDPDRGINLRRIESFKNNLEYLTMKKDHLLKLMKKG